MLRIFATNFSQNDKITKQDSVRKTFDWVRSEKKILKYYLIYYLLMVNFRAKISV